MVRFGLVVRVEGPAMSQEANLKQTRTATEKLARVSSLILKACGVCLIALFALTVLFFIFGYYWAAQACVVFLGVACLVGLLSGILRAGISVFAETQMRLNEMLATVFVAGTITVGLFSAVDFGFADRDVRRAVLGFIVILMAGAGSTWGWSVCKRLGVGETWQRLKFLLYGWLLVPGVCCGIVFMLACANFLIKNNIMVGHGETVDELFRFLVAPTFGSLLMIPAIRTERACRRKAKAAAIPPQENRPPSA